MAKLAEKALISNLTADNNKRMRDILSSSDPDKELKEEIKKFIIPDTFVYKVIVWMLGLVALFALIGSIVLIALDKGLPEITLALGSAAVGALAGALMPQKNE
jgi:hypothetical protein